jgi:flagellar biogenesis protein FliO
MIKKFLWNVGRRRKYLRHLGWNINNQKIGIYEKVDIIKVADFLLVLTFNNELINNLFIY